MNEERKANMIFNRNGTGQITTRITIPVPWAKKLGFTEDNRSAIIKIEDNKIIITKNK